MKRYLFELIIENIKEYPRMEKYMDEYIVEKRKIYDTLSKNEQEWYDISEKYPSILFLNANILIDESSTETDYVVIYLKRENEFSRGDKYYNLEDIISLDEDNINRVI